MGIFPFDPDLKFSAANRNFLWGFPTQTDRIAGNSQDGQGNVGANLDRLARLSTEYQHDSPPWIAFDAGHFAFCCWTLADRSATSRALGMPRIMTFLRIFPNRVKRHSWLVISAISQKQSAPLGLEIRETQAKTGTLMKEPNWIRRIVLTACTPVIQGLIALGAGRTPFVCSFSPES
jgi:hypothetical protein